jgi:hypothetical protein
MVALTALGATVTLSSSPNLKGRGQLDDVDCCLLNSAMLPPQATSTPVHVSELLRHIPNDKPLLDLAWAHQSIIQRKRLPLRGDPRYEVTIGNNKIGGPFKIYSFKTSSKKSFRLRYEVGDLIQFSYKSEATCYGRILSITWKRPKCDLEVQLLVSDECGE